MSLNVFVLQLLHIMSMTPKPSKKGSSKGKASPGGGDADAPTPAPPPAPPLDSPPPPTPAPMGLDYDQLIQGMIAMAPGHIQPFLEHVLKTAHKAKNVDSEALHKAQATLTQCIKL